MITEHEKKSENNLESDCYKEFLGALELLYVRGNRGGRLNFVREWPQAAAHILGEELIRFDTDGVVPEESGENYLRLLEEAAEERWVSLLETVSAAPEKSAEKGVLKLEYVETVVKELGREIALCVYAARIVDRVIPPPPEEKISSQGEDRQEGGAESAAGDVAGENSGSAGGGGGPAISTAAAAAAAAAVSPPPSPFPPIDRQDENSPFQSGSFDDKPPAFPDDTPKVVSSPLAAPPRETPVPQTPPVEPRLAEPPPVNSQPVEPPLSHFARPVSVMPEDIKPIDTQRPSSLSSPSVPAPPPVESPLVAPSQVAPPPVIPSQVAPPPPLPPTSPPSEVETPMVFMAAKRSTPPAHAEGHEAGEDKGEDKENPLSYTRPFPPVEDESGQA